MQLVEVFTAGVEMIESGDSASLEDVSLITSIESGVLWECWSVIIDGDGDDG